MSLLSYGEEHAARAPMSKAARGLRRLLGIIRIMILAAQGRGPPLHSALLSITSLQEDCRVHYARRARADLAIRALSSRLPYD